MHSVLDNTLLQHLRIYTSMCDAITVAAAQETLEYVIMLRKTADATGIATLHESVYRATERAVDNGD